MQTKLEHFQESTDRGAEELVSAIGLLGLRALFRPRHLVVLLDFHDMGIAIRRHHTGAYPSLIFERCKRFMLSDLMLCR